MKMALFHIFVFRFGVCCIFLVTATGSTINQNCTYLRNPSFPSVYSGTSSLSYTVSKCSSGNKPSQLFEIKSWKVIYLVMRVSLKNYHQRIKNFLYFRRLLFATWLWNFYDYRTHFINGSRILRVSRHLQSYCKTS